MNTTQPIYCKIEALTPVHIGIGAEKAWQNGLDFIQDEKGVHIINQEQLFQVIPAEKMNDFMSYLAKGKMTEWTLLKQFLKGTVIHYSFQFPFKLDKEIRSFLRTGQGQPYIAGSSLKGAIRSVLFKLLYKQLAPQNAKVKKEVFNEAIKKKEWKEVSLEKKEYDKYLFGTIENNIMRMVQVTDAHFTTTRLARVKLFNLKSKESGGWKHGDSNTTTEFDTEKFTTDYEVIDTTCGVGVCRISLPNHFHPTILAKIKTHLHQTHNHLPKTATDLFELINTHTKTYIQKQLKFFTTYEVAKTETVRAMYEKLLAQIPTDNSYCILKMSAGSGYHSIRGDWEFEDFTNTGTWGETAIRKADKEKIKAKTRKIAFSDATNLLPMGFVKLTKIDESLYQTILAKNSVGTLMAEKQQQLQQQAQKEQALLAEQAAKKEAELKEKLMEFPQYTANLQNGVEIEAKISDVGNFFMAQYSTNEKLDLSQKAELLIPKGSIDKTTLNRGQLVMARYEKSKNGKVTLTFIKLVTR
jgi:CRISPR/Cas system CSM-associated protein Csm5 (group 7 of RAMP superfamily)